MSRAHRIHAPGAGIHITARLQGRERLLTPELRADIAAFITEAARPCGNRILALTVMPNHFHIVLKQAHMPLGWMMQRVMQRTVCLIKRVYNVDGHVFGAPYWSAVCGNVTYLRQAIVYTHLNGWKAGLCPDNSDAGSYCCTTHNLCAGRALSSDWARGVAADETRMLFADESLDSTSVSLNYMRFTNYWMKRHTTGIPGDKFVFTLPSEDPPRAMLGDAHWMSTYTQAYRTIRPAVAQMDVRDRAIFILRRIDPDCSLDMIRNTGRLRQLCRIRRELIAALRTYGYRPYAIARCLRVSPSVISDVDAKSVAA